jgi:hypothetical protein
MVVPPETTSLQPENRKLLKGKSRPIGPDIRKGGKSRLRRFQLEQTIVAIAGIRVNDAATL